MTGAYGDLDYPTLTKRTFFLGVALFLIGAVGELGLHAAGVSVPQWERTLLFDMEIVGIVIALLSPFVFGILLPLTE
jgi:hydrogenase/urease accessory protein HupE